MTPEEILAHFTNPDGSYQFARWGRPIAPMIYGVDAASLPVLKGAIALVCDLTGHQMADTDPEIGFNSLFIYLKDWAELAEAEGAERLIPDPKGLAARLAAEDAQQYRLFAFAPEGGIRSCLSLIRMQGAMAEMPADVLALRQAIGAHLRWGPAAFGPEGPMGMDAGKLVIRPEVIALMRAAYDPALPVSAADGAHALRVFARLRG